MVENDSTHLDQGSPLVCRGVRGAVTATENSEKAIIDATYELLQTIVELNDMHPDDVASVYFTTTVDLNATYPALAARQMGWYDTALICGHEMNVPDSLPRCIRILIHWNTSLTAKEINHVYLGDAQSLRPDRNQNININHIQYVKNEEPENIVESRV